MVKKTFTVLSMLCLSLAVFTMAIAQETVIYRISNAGQEAIPVKKGETVRQALERITMSKDVSISSPNGLVDKLKYYDSTGTASNFGFTHQDVMFGWFKPEAGGAVKSVVWRNYGLTGDNGKAKVRAWIVDPRVESLPVTAGANGSRSAMGYYIDANDGDQNVTAFKDVATNKTFVPAVGNPDSAKVSFDPLGTESAWLAGGLQVTLDSAKWQGVDMLSWGDSMKVKQGELFGFTVLQASPPGGADARMEVWAYGNTAHPFHSYKFYEAARAGNKGWHIRGDFEWAMYAVVDYNTDRAPKAATQTLFTTLSKAPRPVKATVTDDNPSGGAKGVKSVDLYAKINSGAYVKSTMTGTEPNYTGTLPAGASNDTISYYVVATDVNNNATTTGVKSYTIFTQTKRYLAMYNGRSLPAGFTASTISRYYMAKDSANEPVYFDTWDVKNYGTADIPALLPYYRVVVEATGDGGYSDLTKFAGDWLGAATKTERRAWVFSDQDHGFISGYADTTFTDTDAHAKYFGMKALINQDYPYVANGNRNVTKDWQITLDTTSDKTTFKYLADRMKTDTSKLWYNPNFTLSATYLNWIDQITPTASAKVMFRDKTGGKDYVIGLRNMAADSSWNTFTFAFDYLALHTRQDTAGGPGTTRKYKWNIPSKANPGSLLKSIITSGITSVEPISNVVPGTYGLSQNYPNPFNPSTTIEYNVPVRSNVQVTIFNVLGQKVATIMNDMHEAGTHRATWNGKDQFGKTVASGIYFYQMRAGSFEQVKKMMLMK